MALLGSCTFPRASSLQPQWYTSTTAYMGLTGTRRSWIGAVPIAAGNDSLVWICWLQRNSSSDWCCRTVGVLDRDVTCGGCVGKMHWRPVGAHGCQTVISGPGSSGSSVQIKVGRGTGLEPVPSRAGADGTQGYELGTVGTLVGGVAAAAAARGSLSPCRRRLRASPSSRPCLVSPLSPSVSRRRAGREWIAGHGPWAELSSTWRTWLARSLHVDVYSVLLLTLSRSKRDQIETCCPTVAAWLCRVLSLRLSP